MTILGINFRKWNGAARGGTLRIISKRIYYKGYVWTPFVWITFKNLNRLSKA